MFEVEIQWTIAVIDFVVAIFQLPIESWPFLRQIFHFVVAILLLIPEVPVPQHFSLQYFPGDFGVNFEFLLVL